MAPQLKASRAPYGLHLQRPNSNTGNCGSYTQVPIAILMVPLRGDDGRVRKTATNCKRPATALPCPWRRLMPSAPKPESLKSQGWGPGPQPQYPWT